MLERTQVEKAAKALLTHVEVERSKASKKLLVDDVVPVYLVVTLSKVPHESKLKPIRIEIPHSIHHDAEVCVFTKDPQREFKDKFSEQGVAVEKVVGLSKLKANYKSFEQKRKLSQSYDMFMVDNRVVKFMPNLLGQHFFRFKKQPIPVDLSKANLKKVIARARDSTYMFRSSGVTCSVKIGRTDFSEEELVENIMVGANNVIARVTQKWKGVSSIAIKTQASISLPIYQALPSLTPMASKVVEDGAVLRKRKREGEDDEDDGGAAASVEAEDDGNVAATSAASASGAKGRAKRRRTRE